MVRVVIGYGHPQACSPIVRSPQGPPRPASFWFEIRISFINFNFFLSEAVREVPGTLVATTLGPRPLGSVALLRSQGAGGQRTFIAPLLGRLDGARPAAAICWTLGFGYSLPGGGHRHHARGRTVGVTTGSLRSLGGVRRRHRVWFAS